MAGETNNTSGKTIGAGGSSFAGSEDGIFEKYPPAQWTVAGQTLAFPVMRISETGGNRIIPRERPYRDGAKLDDTGSKPKQWTMECIFNDTVTEADSINKGKPLYPDVLNDIIFNFDVHATGDLVVPTIGSQRVRAESYTRTESFDERDVALLTLVFTADNEDAVDLRSITVPTANANARRLADTTSFDTQSFGSWHDSLAQLDVLMGSLEDVVNAPGEVAEDVEATNQRIAGNVKRALATFKRASKPGRGLFLDPENSRGERKLVQQCDMAAKAANDSRRARPQLITVVYQAPTTIFRVAAMLGQDAVDLMAVNPRVDPMVIPALFPVKVFATQELLNGSTPT